MVDLINDKIKRISRELQSIQIDLKNHTKNDLQVQKLDSVIEKLHEIRKEIN